MQVLLVGEDEEYDEEETNGSDNSHVHLDSVEVSLNSVIGFTSPHTMKLRSNIGGFDIVVLIDSGATHNFISQELVERLGLFVSKTGYVGVMMGNGNFERSHGMCKKVILSFPELQVIEDLFRLC